MLHGKVIRVMWSHHDSDARSGIGNVFVKACLSALTSMIDVVLYFLFFLWFVVSWLHL